ncbi:5-formyltetrahydrofolate cyclo-ligase [Anderseniella sp. Alg231-50]|uniref:5-formyltetrahydrofolate cyclo-ligase n=1 Tax=Anderseniella sp. Alg231-50 TaxID=1922226 RepID=UPI000D55D264
MTDHQSISDAKKLARKAAGDVRKTAHGLLKISAAQALVDCGLEFAGEMAGKTVSGFIPYLSEIDTRALLGMLGAQGIETCVPVVIENNTPLEFRTWAPGDPTVPGRWGIPIPPDGSPVVDPDVLLVPMLSYDRSGYRLGYGGGFYDRTLEKLRAMKPVTAIGVAYSAQQVDAVIRGEHDQPLDWILTEKGPLKPGTKI